MLLYRLGLLPWAETQLIYHALARLGREAIVLCGSRDPYVCVGFHQDVRQEVDLAFCERNGIGIFRREAGGGTVYLDPAQFFYQIVARRESVAPPWNREAFYRACLGPVGRALDAWGIDAQFVPSCDLAVRGRKISGNGGGEIGEAKVFIGNILLDFDSERMARVLRCPNEEFRWLFRQEMDHSLTTVRREIGRIPPWHEIETRMAMEFQRAFGPLEETPIDPTLAGAMAQAGADLLADHWRFHPGPRRATAPRTVRVREGRFLVEVEGGARIVDVPPGREPERAPG